MAVLVAFVPGFVGLPAVAAAIELARLRGEPIHLRSHVRVTDSSANEAVAGLIDAIGKAEDRVRSHGIEVASEWTVGTNLFSTEILRTVEEIDVSLVVVAYRPRSLVGKIILGSHLQDIILNSTCPVLAIPVRD